MALSRLEQETVICFNEAENTANVYTHNGRLTRKLEQLVEDHSDECRKVREREYEVPKKWIRINASRKSVELTEEQKEEARKRLKAMNAARAAKRKS